MAKELLFEEEAREKLKKGIQKLADVVAPTLGPRARNIGVDASFGPPSITSDGASIVKEIEDKDQFVNMGMSMGKEVAAKTKEMCGDGTTTSILLLNAIVKEGFKQIASGHSPIMIKRGLEKALAAVIEEIGKSAIEVKEEIETIATVSASGDQEIGSTIAEAIKLAGKSGVITIELGKKSETIIESVEGMQFDRGYISRYFCNNPETMTLTMENPYILVTDKKISAIQELIPLLQSVAATGQELLIIAEDVEADALSTLVINRMRGALKVAAVKAPGFGDRRKAMLEDIAALTGATLISEETGLLLKNTTVEALGRAAKIEINKDATTIIDGSGSPSIIQARIGQIESELKTSTGYDKEKLEERKAKLSGGVVIIHVGGVTEPETKRKKQDFEDALSATRAALEEGIVPGGGAAYLHASTVIDSLSLSDEEKVGAQILKRALEAPMRQIAVNSGFDGSLIIEEVKRKGEDFGFNVISEEVENLISGGVVNPAKVERSSLKHAVSAGALFLLSDVLIGDASDEECAS